MAGRSGPHQCPQDERHGRDGHRALTPRTDCRSGRLPELWGLTTQQCSETSKVLQMEQRTRMTASPPFPTLRAETAAAVARVMATNRSSGSGVTFVTSSARNGASSGAIPSSGVTFLTERTPNRFPCSKWNTRRRNVPGWHRSRRPRCSIWNDRTPQGRERSQHTRDWRGLLCGFRTKLRRHLGNRCRGGPSATRARRREHDDPPDPEAPRFSPAGQAVSRGAGPSGPARRPTAPTGGPGSPALRLSPRIGPDRRALLRGGSDGRWLRPTWRPRSPGAAVAMRGHYPAPSVAPAAKDGAQAASGGMRTKPRDA